MVGSLSSSLSNLLKPEIRISSIGVKMKSLQAAIFVIEGVCSSTEVHCFSSCEHAVTEK